MTLVLLLLSGQVLDLLTFSLALHTYGPSGETNPGMGTLAATYGLYGIALAKVIGIGALLAAGYALRRRRRLLLWVAAVGYVGALTNLVAFHG